MQQQLQEKKQEILDKQEAVTKTEEIIKVLDERKAQIRLKICDQKFNEK